ncbi:MAG: CoB--CoM heterodisulfide reductase iron-sulfur subunit B family protein [Elusimicrobiota bacterium]
MLSEKKLSFAYMPGCSLTSTAREYEVSARRIAQALDIELLEIPGWVCCGGSSAHLTDESLAGLLPIQSLAWAEENNLSVVTPCPACFQRLKLANQAIFQEQKLKEEAEKILGRAYKNKIEVWHFLQLFSREDIQQRLKNKIKKPLEDLKLACYYGCLLARPQSLTALEDAENPALLENLLELLGAKVVDWSGKTDCCGANHSIGAPLVAEKLTNLILEKIKDAGAELVVVACQLCQANLDLRQKQIEKKFEQKYNLPIVYFTQLLGLALGLSADALGLDKHLISPLPALMKKTM